ncbi:MAG: hypothetical protein R3202_08475 [Candidatus Competibacterales bacterium]|nr:hypothetical protein [Candidatus Competibacterales bacterium]
MKRYREGEMPRELGEPVVDYLLLGTLVYALLLGIGFVIAGRRLRQLWMVVWGAGLVVVSLGGLVMQAAGWP